MQKVLLSHLLDFLNQEGQGACLFVKKENLAAFNLYLSLGFGDPGDFRIGYWLRGTGPGNAGLTGALPPNSP